MFLNHTKDFTPFFSAADVPACTLATDTMLETPQGWRSAATFVAGDRVSTLDGGFATITRLTHTLKTQAMMLVPHGALDNCTDMLLPADQSVALRSNLHESPYVLARIGAMTGYRGIRPTFEASSSGTVTLGFGEEEIVYAQTGALIHAPATSGESFFKHLSYGETRATLIMMNNGFCAPDIAA